MILKRLKSLGGHTFFCLRIFVLVSLCLRHECCVKLRIFILVFFCHKNFFVVHGKYLIRQCAVIILRKTLLPMISAGSLIRINLVDWEISWSSDSICKLLCRRCSSFCCRFRHLLWIPIWAWIWSWIYSWIQAFFRVKFCGDFSRTPFSICTWRQNSIILSCAPW